MSIFKRPEATVTVAASKSDTAASAMTRHGIFVNLVMKHRLELVSSEGKDMTLRGRPKHVAAFKQEHARLADLGLV